MKKFDYYYFCLYNLFYRDGRGVKYPADPTQLSIKQRPVFLFCLSTWAWTCLIRFLIAAFFHPILHIVFIEGYEFLFPLLSYTGYYFYFIDNNHYLNIYAKYKLTDKGTQKQDSKNILIFLVLPIPLIILSGLCIKYILKINLHTII